MRILATLFVAAGLVYAAIPAQAQRGAASKITGSAYEYPYFYRSAGAYQDAAYQHADVLREAASYGESVPREVAAEQIAAIRRNLEAAGRKYEGLRNMAGDNKDVQKHLDAIAAHHKKAAAALDKVEAHVAKGPGDPETVSGAMHDVASSLKSAQAEHEHVMQYFGRPPTGK